MKKILIVEDDLALSSGLCFELDTSGYLTSAAYTLEKADRLLKEESFHLVLLDVNLPDGNGFDLCKKIKADFPEIPVIFLTANDMDKDVINGFDLGADDYITKPYNVPVLLARVRTVLRRCGGLREADILEANGLTLHLTKGIAEKDGQKAELTRNELKILARLMSDKGEIVSRSDLLESLWDNQIYIDDNTLSVNITRLRAKLEEIGLPDFIKTRRGMGYQL